MGLYIKTGTEFDFLSAELVFFYIDDFTVFKKQGFCFFPKYQIVNYEYKKNVDFTIALKRKTDFVDLFAEERVNVKVLCGKNGCGKSTLLEVIAGTKSTGIEIFRFYLLKDKTGNFASSCKCNLNIDDNAISLVSYCLDDFSPHDSCVNHKNMQIPDFDFRKNIVKFYTETPDLYDGVVNDKLFTHFSVELWNFDNEIDLLMFGKRKNLFNNENIFEIKGWLKTDILSYFLLCNMQDNTYDEAARCFEEQMAENETDLHTFLNDFVYTNYAPHIADEIRERQNELFSRAFLISNLAEIEKKIAGLEGKILEFLQAFDYDMRESQFVPTRLKDLLYFRGYSDKTMPARFISDLSDGEWRSIKFRYEILHSMFQSNGFWWYIDAPEACLHPEWCRTFISDYMAAYKKVKNYLISIRDYAPNNSFNLPRV